MFVCHDHELRLVWDIIGLKMYPSNAIPGFPDLTLVESACILQQTLGCIDSDKLQSPRFWG